MLIGSPDKPPRPCPGGQLDLQGNARTRTSKPVTKFLWDKAEKVWPVMDGSWVQKGVSGERKIDEAEDDLRCRKVSIGTRIVRKDYDARYVLIPTKEYCCRTRGPHEAVSSALISSQHKYSRHLTDCQIYIYP